MSCSRLEAEAAELERTVATAAKNPFLPAPARDAIVQAGYVIQSLVLEVKDLRARLATNGDTINGQLLEMRQQLSKANGGPL